VHSYIEEAKRRQVWAKGHIMTDRPDLDPNEWRRDDFGWIIRYSEYGDRNAAYGWEIDHIHPTAFGGHDHISNLRPLHCQCNSGLGGILGGLLRG
jgi:5-methylcytosine-specific restriction endonuclease McrA